MVEENKTSPVPAVDVKLKELQALLESVDEDGQYIELTEEQDKEVKAKWSELAKKYGSWGSALKKKDADALDFLMTMGTREDESSRVSYHDKEKRKEMIESLMFYAISESSVDVLKVVLKHALHYGLKLDLESKKPIQKPGSNPDRPDMRYVSAPFMAAEQDNWETLLWLFNENHLSIDFRGNNDETLFMAAVSNHKFELADRLLSISPSQENTMNAVTTLYNQTALHTAAQEGDEEALAYLIIRRADPTIQSQSGHLASEYLPEEEEYVSHFDVLEDYREAYMAGQPFAPPGEWYLDGEGKEPKWMTDGIPTPETSSTRRATMAM